MNFNQQKVQLLIERGFRDAYQVLEPLLHIHSIQKETKRILLDRIALSNQSSVLHQQRKEEWQIGNQKINQLLDNLEKRR